MIATGGRAASQLQQPSLPLSGMFQGNLAPVASDMPNDVDEYIELKNDYKKVKRSLKAMRNDPNVNPLDKQEKIDIKKQMRLIMKQSEKLNSDWKARYKANRKQH